MEGGAGTYCCALVMAERIIKHCACWRSKAINNLKHAQRKAFPEDLAWPLIWLDLLEMIKSVSLRYIFECTNLSSHNFTRKEK